MKTAKETASVASSPAGASTAKAAASVVGAIENLARQATGKEIAIVACSPLLARGSLGKATAAVVVENGSLTYEIQMACG